MEAEYYQPQIELLLCRHRLAVTDWNRDISLKEPFWRLYWHRRNPARLRFKDNVHFFDCNTLVLIAPETDFYPQMRDPFDQFYIHFQASYPFDACHQKLFTFPITEEFIRRIEVVNGMLMREERRPSRQLALLATAICLDALALIPDDQLEHDFTDRQLLVILDHLRRHYTEEIDNAELAAMVQMHKNSFIRFFRRHLGMTPQQYLRELRIREACLLLRFSTNTIDEIATATGFYDRFYFSRVFKKIRGLSPAEFRRKIS